MYYVKSLPILREVLQVLALFPTGRYKTEINITSLDTKVKYYFVTGVAEVRNKPILFW